MPQPNITRRRALALFAAAAIPAGLPLRAAANEPTHPDPRWYEKAEEMRALARSWGDQSYGAVVVLRQQLVGLGPSRVVKDRDPDAHAERVAIRDAQRALGSEDLRGAVLYSTSRPCRVCEAAAARAGLSRMYHGPALADAGTPRE